MALSQRVFLIIGSLATLLYFISNIRKSKLKISHSIFWVVFGVVLLVLACVPDGFFWISKLLGFQSPSNLIYLIVIFFLTVKLFTTTMKLSKLSEQVTTLAQSVAIYQMEIAQSKQNKEETSEGSVV